MDKNDNSTVSQPEATVSSCHCLRANGRRRARQSFDNIEEQQRGVRAHDEGCRITVFLSTVKRCTGVPRKWNGNFLLAATVCLYLIAYLEIGRILTRFGVKYLVFVLYFINCSHLL